jgi:ribosomal protein L13
MGDYIVIINAEKVTVTGNKFDDKMYHHHTGYVGNLKSWIRPCPVSTRRIHNVAVWLLFVRSLSYVKITLPQRIQKLRS